MMNRLGTSLMFGRIDRDLQAAATQYDEQQHPIKGMLRELDATQKEIDKATEYTYEMRYLKYDPSDAPKHLVEKMATLEKKLLAKLKKMSAKQARKVVEWLKPLKHFQVDAKDKVGSVLMEKLDA